MTSTVDSRVRAACDPEPDADTAKTPFPTVVEAVLHRLRRTPDAIVVRDAEGELTAAELDRWTAAVAEEILGLVGRDGHRRVGLDLGRGVRHVVGFLAALRAGCSAVPLDPSAPQRMSQIVRAAAPVAVLVGPEPATSRATGTAPADPAGSAVVRLAIDPLRHRPAREFESAARPAPAPEDEAYLLFTSGSTGVPKGVRIPHGALAAFAWSMSRYLGITDADRVLALTATTFDPSVMEMFCALVHGAPLFVAGAAERMDPVLLQEFCVHHRITYGFFPVAVLPLLHPEALPTLRVLQTGAEAPGPEQVERWTTGSDRRFINSYGPTESTVAVCSLDASGRWTSALPIGRPHGGHKLVIADPDSLLPVPFGDDGELLIAGPGLALDYLDDPELTADRFVVLDGVRYYRTGDRCRWNADHTVQFLGRADRQVKIRGHRIELGEVEAALTAHPVVGLAVADIDRAADGSRRLVAHHTGEVAAADLADWLADRLPSAMIPSAIHHEDALPRNASDKIDLSALAARRAARDAAEAARIVPPTDVAPTADGGRPTDVADAVLGLWIEHVGPAVEGAGLYACGGSSVSAMTMVDGIRRRTGRTVRTVEVVRAADAGSLARLVAARAPDPGAGTYSPATSVTPPAHVDTRAGADAEPPDRLSAAQQRLWLTELVSRSSHESNIAVAYSLVGPLDRDALRSALASLLDRHPVLRWSFPEVAGRGVIRMSAPPARLLEVHEVPAGATASAVRDLVRQHFDIAAGPLWNATLLHEVDRGDDEHLLVLTFHHLVCDGWSVGPLVDDLAAGYRRAIVGDPPDASPAGSFAAHIEWEHERHCNGGPADALWWAEHLAGVPDMIELADPAPTAATSVGAERAIGEYSASLHRDRAALDEAARSLNASTAAVLLATLGVLLRRRTGCDEVVVGLVAAGRDHPESVATVGMFSDIVPVVLRPGASPTFRAAVLAADQEIADTADHAAVSLQEIIRVARARRFDDRGTLVQVLFNLYNFPLPIPDLGGPVVTAVEVPASGSPFDLTLYVQPDPSSTEHDGATAVMISRAVLRPGLVARGDQVPQEFSSLLAALLADPVAPLQISVPASLTEATAAPPAGDASAGSASDDTPAGSAFHDTGHGRRASASVPPATPTERALVAIWTDVLQSEITGVTDNFFDVGGHSLAVAEVRAGIATQLGREVSMVDLFTWPTIREIADQLDAAVARSAAPIDTAGGRPTTPVAAPVDRGAARRAAARRSPRTAPQRRERS
ncbi:MAG: amino acid adenylation domain-containing protein [Nakamurella sp.]